MKKSIQRRLITGQIIAQVALVAVFSVFIYKFVEDRLLEQFDYSLRQIADSATTMVKLEIEGGGRVEVELEDDFTPNIDEATTYQQVWTADKTAIYSSPNFKLAKWKLPELDYSELKFGTVDFPDGRTGRYCMLPFQPFVDDQAVIESDDWLAISIRDSSPVDIPLEKIKLGCIWFGGAASVLSILVNLVLIRWEFRPLRRIASEVDQLNVDQLDSRICEKSLPLELQGITGKLNSMLSRVEEYIEREKRFTSNVAHELRTPLAEMKVIAEVGGLWKPEYLPEDDPRSYFRDSKATADRMQTLLETLLALVRRQEDQLELSYENVQVRRTADKVCSLFDWGSRNVVFEGDAVEIQTNQHLFEALLVNLFGNAHAHSKGDVLCRWSSNELCISNHTSGLTKEDIERVSEPFWQKDKARTDQDHSGLGLSLSQSYCDLLGLGLTFDIDADEQFVVFLTFKSQSE